MNATKLLWDLLRDHLGQNFAEDSVLHHTIFELSKSFTEGRENLRPDYLKSVKTQKAYLAYFVPVNFEKVRLLLKSHPGVWAQDLVERNQSERYNERAEQHWIDFGCGPGTATLAALALFAKKATPQSFVHIDLVDNQPEALEMAVTLVEDYAEKLGVKVKVTTHEKFSFPKEPKYDLALAANVLNELPPEAGPTAREVLLELWDATRGTFLLLEPGHRVSSQRLVRFRERLLKTDKENVEILGPCKHAEQCPIHRTKHWCHFSEPLNDGRLIDLNLRIFKDPRSWLKFSYLLVKREKSVAAWDGKTFRAIGDLHQSGPNNLAIDLCQPGEKYVLRLPKNLPPHKRLSIVRGAIVKLDKTERFPEAIGRPMTKREPREDSRSSQARHVPKKRISIGQLPRSLVRPKNTR